MSLEAVEKVAEAVLYEGYLLFPSRHSSMKNQQRWTFGGVYPRGYSETSGGADPWCMQTQCLVLGGEQTALTVKVRFLQVVDRTVAQHDGELRRDVAALRVGDQVYRPADEASERAIVASGTAGDTSLLLGALLASSVRMPIEIGAGSEDEPLIDAAGAVVGTLTRRWQALQALVEIAAEPLVTSRDTSPFPAPSYLLTVRIANTTPWATADPRSGVRPRDAALRRTLVSTHTILQVRGGEFVSLLEPPVAYQQAVVRCRNEHTWPVLVGEPGERHTLLSSPIILYDYPSVSPESPGNLFDATEIDELLTLSILTLTDEERQEMRESEARGREILERTEALTPDQILQLHASVRGVLAARREEP